MNKLDKFWYRTSYIVLFYASFMVFCMIYQACLSLLVKMNLGANWKVFTQYLNGNLTLPISDMAEWWKYICAGYVCIDRVAYTTKTAILSSGQTDFGDPQMLRRIIFASTILFCIALICNSFVDANFELSSFVDGVGGSCLFYILGQKAIKTAKYVDGKLDSNGDGIPDEEQERDSDGNIIFGSRK